MATDLDPTLGTLIGGRYQIESRIGRGGMGAVYRAVQTKLGRPVAIKILSHAASADRSMVERFRREARAISRLDHPHCVRVLDAGTTEDGLHYLVMPLLDGTDLRRHMQGPSDPALAARRALQITRALEHAHRRGIIHRDLKPENVIVTDDSAGEVLQLVDFGLAKITRDNAAGVLVTQAGVVFGTPDYMSPEQCKGEAVDGRSDLYSLGAMLYEMLTGRPPFGQGEPLEILRRHLYEVVPPMPPSVPAALQRIVFALLEKSQATRMPSATVLRHDLEAFLSRTTADTATRRPPLTPSTTPAAPTRKMPVTDLAGATTGAWELGDDAWSLGEHERPTEHNLGRGRMTGVFATIAASALAAAAVLLVPQSTPVTAMTSATQALVDLPHPRHRPELERLALLVSEREPDTTVEPRGTAVDAVSSDDGTRPQPSTPNASTSKRSTASSSATGSASSKPSTSTPSAPDKPSTSTKASTASKPKVSKPKSRTPKPRTRPTLTTSKPPRLGKLPAPPESPRALPTIDGESQRKRLLPGGTTTTRDARLPS